MIFSRPWYQAHFALRAPPPPPPPEYSAIAEHTSIQTHVVRLIYVHRVQVCDALLCSTNKSSWTIAKCDRIIQKNLHNTQFHFSTQYVTNQTGFALRAPPPPPPPKHSANSRAHLYPDAHRAPYLHASQPEMRCVSVQHEEE